MKILYFDCFSGIAGDMVLGALIDAGLDINILKKGLKKLNIKGYELVAKKVMRKALSGTKLDVIIKRPSGGHSHRSLVEVLKLIDDSSLEGRVKDNAKKIFNLIGKAESKIHGIADKKKLHLHELGDIDSIIDIVGVAIAIDSLEIDEIHSSVVSFGRTILNTKGGVLPAPSPASLEILRDVPVKISGVDSELVTPTGAGILKALTKGFGDMPQMRVAQIGYGAGSNELNDIPNMLRVMIGESSSSFEEDKAFVIETNIDDMNPQNFEYLFERLFKDGALDAYTTTVHMKKSRPAFKLTVLSDRTKLEKLCSTIFSETTSIGIRYYEVDRFKLRREIVKVNTRYGNINVKLSKCPDNTFTVSPEYEECVKAARAEGVPLKRVYEEAKHGASHYDRSKVSRRSKMAQTFLIIAAFISLVTGYAAADTIYTKDGKELKGIITEDYKDRVLFNTIDGQLTIMKSEIRELYYDTEEQNLIKLAEQSRDKGDYIKSFVYYDRAFKKNPGSKTAKDGIVFIQGYLFKKDMSQKEEAVNRRNEFEQRGAQASIKSDEDKFNESLQKLQSDAGVTLVTTDGVTIIESVRKNSQADNAGIVSGDILVAIWGRLCGYMTLKDVVENLREKNSLETKVTLERNLTMRVRPFDSIGATLAMQFDGLTVTKIKEGSTGYEAGLRPDDIIIEINGNPTSYMPLKKAITLIKRSKDGKVNLTVRKDVVMWGKGGV
jgi:TIGR00299 family protein